MRYLLLVAGLLLAGSSWGQGSTNGEQFVGVWKDLAAARGKILELLEKK